MSPPNTTYTMTHALLALLRPFCAEHGLSHSAVEDILRPVLLQLPDRVWSLEWRLYHDPEYEACDLEIALGCDVTPERFPHSHGYPALLNIEVHDNGCLEMRAPTLGSPIHNYNDDDPDAPEEARAWFASILDALTRPLSDEEREAQEQETLQRAVFRRALRDMVNGITFEWG